MLGRGQLAGFAVGADVEADDDGVRRVGQDDVALGDPADTSWTNERRTSSWSLVELARAPR